jgi:hypothetical protein
MYMSHKTQYVSKTYFLKDLKLHIKCTILLCVTIFVFHKQCFLILDHCSIITVSRLDQAYWRSPPESSSAAAEEEEDGRRNSSALAAGYVDRDCIASNRNITLLTNNDIKHLSAHLKCCVVKKIVLWNSNYNPRATPSGYNFEFPRTIFCHNTTL